MPEESADAEVAADPAASNAVLDKSVQAGEFVKEMILRIEKLQEENNFRDATSGST